MKKGKSRVSYALLLTGFIILLLAGANSAVYGQEGSFFLPEFEPSLSADGQTLHDAVPPLVIVVDPNPYTQGIKVPGPTAADALTSPEAAGSTFSITYIPAGGTDPWNQECVTFPAAAKTAFNAAAAIWAKTLKSSVPITINACWADLGSPSILGYSGGQPQHRNFAGAPKADTWYQDSLANSIAGSDLTPASFDMNITYNNGFSWYFGTDSNPPANEFDLVTVAAHEIGHGLNFSGMATYSGGTGSFGYNGSPNVYDTFMESGAGKALTTYTNPSTALGTLLTSNDLWFNGTNAKAANGGARLKMYAPSTWAGGSSYSHLDYNTFAGTSNSLMVYAVSPGAANHNPGTVTKGLMKDLGWKMATESVVPTPQSPSGNITDTSPTYIWTKVTGATQYSFQLLKGTNTTPVYTKTITSPVCGTTTCSSTPTKVLALASYKWKVRAMVGGVWKAYSPFTAFTVKEPVPTPKSPSGTITDKTPTYKWTTVSGATQYRYQLLKGTNTTPVYTKTVASSACGTSTCSNTPTTALVLASYKWKVQALVGGVWKAYSAFKSFTVTAAPTGPKAGFWESTTGDEFYVTTDQKNVDDFAIYVNVTGCGVIKITRTALAPIVNSKFSFSGSFYASGTFDSTTSAHGTDGLDSYYSTTCGGYVSGGPWAWTATWTDASQPTIVVDGAAASVIEAPAPKGLNSHTVMPD